MVEDYDPKLKDVLPEILRGGIATIPREGIKLGKKSISPLSTAIREVRDFSLGLGGSFASWTMSPYMLPTAYRKSSENGILSNGYEQPENFGAVLGSLAGMVADLGQFVFYVEYSIIGHPEVLAIPAATNAVSAAYEVGRNAYIHAKDRVMERHQSRGLEDSL